MSRGASNQLAYTQGENKTDHSNEPKIGLTVEDGFGPTIGKSNGLLRVDKRDKLADYSWVELKELSQAITVGGSDEEGQRIALEYRLVDKDGRLQGDEKPFEFKTKRSARILGFRQDDLEASDVAGISFEFVDVPTEYCMNVRRNNTGGWEKSDMRFGCAIIYNLAVALIELLFQRPGGGVCNFMHLEQMLTASQLRRMPIFR